MPPDALLPPEQLPTPQSPELEALLVQQEHQHEQLMGSMDALIHQTAKNDPEPLLDTLIQQTDEVKSAIQKTGEDLTKTVEGVKPDIADAIKAALEGIEIAKKKEIQKGDKGEQGEKGDTGEKGEKGDAGTDGEMGPMGPMGPKGDRGERGLDGIDGDVGPMGPPGAKGADGSPDTGVEIVSKLSALKEMDRLSYHALKDVPLIFKNGPGERIPRGGGSRDYAFTELTDTPKSYANQAGKWLRVNLAGTALEFISSGVTKLVAGTNISLTPSSGLGDVTVNVTGMPVDAFVQGGNSFGTTASIGTNDAQALAFETGGTERMRLLTNGRVGIGTSSPAVPLDVRGLIYAEINSITVPGFAFSNAPTYGMGYISGNLSLMAGGVPALVLTPISSNYRIPRDWTYSWSANVGNDNFPDTGMSRISANRIAMGNGTFGNATATVVAARFQAAKGASVAAANNLTLGLDGQSFVITGNTQINAITTSTWNVGSEITLIFTGTPTVKHNTAGGAGTAPLLLSAGVDLAASNPVVLKLIYDGTNWQEVSRSINHV